MQDFNLFVANFRSLVQEIDANGGASVWTNFDKLNELPITEVLNKVSTGYSVGNNNYSSIITDWNCLSKEQRFEQLIAACLDTSIRYEINNSEFPCLGFWLDTNTARVYVDPITHVEVLADAMNLGSANGELAIWDISLGREIKLKSVAQSERQC